MLKIMGKIIFTILREKFCLSDPMLDTDTSFTVLKIGVKF